MLFFKNPLKFFKHIIQLHDYLRVCWFIDKHVHILGLLESTNDNMCHLIMSQPSDLMFDVVMGFLSVAKSTKCDLCLNSCSACSHSLANKTPKSHIWNGFVGRRKGGL